VLSSSPWFFLLSSSTGKSLFALVATHVSRVSGQEGKCATKENSKIPMMNASSKLVVMLNELRDNWTKRFLD